MAILSAETQAKLGPALGVVKFLLAVVFGIAVYHWTGGQPIPYLSQITAIVLGLGGLFWAANELKKS